MAGLRLNINEQLRVGVRMARNVLSYMIALGLALVDATHTLAAPDRPRQGLFGGRAPSAAPRMELVVFERAGCGYCEMFRARIAPDYASGTAGGRAPLRYVDLDRSDIDEVAMGLKARITVLPTAVLMRDGAEVDRIVGLTAPQTFHTLIQYMMPSDE
jgi:hypothetical protein